MEETVQRVSGRCDDMRFPCEVRLSVGTGKAFCRVSVSVLPALRALSIKSEWNRGLLPPLAECSFCIGGGFFYATSYNERRCFLVPKA